MQNNYLRAVEIKERYLRLLAKQIRLFFKTSIFDDIFAIIDGKKLVLNDLNVILTALRTGRIYYKDGVFRAEKQFSNNVALELERLGAVYKRGGYAINPQNLPVNILNEIAVLQVEAKSKLNAIDLFLQQLQIPDITSFVKGLVNQMFDSFCNDLYASLKEKNIPIIELPIDNPNITIPEEEVKRISQYWQEKKRKHIN